MYQPILVIGVGALARYILLPPNLVREDGVCRRLPGRDTLVHGVSPLRPIPINDRGQCPTPIRRSAENTGTRPGLAPSGIAGS